MISSYSLAFIKDDNLAIESSDSEPLSLELIKYRFFAFKDLIRPIKHWLHNHFRQFSFGIAAKGNVKTVTIVPP